MFVLHPDGASDGTDGPAGNSLSTKLWFFGKLGIYFGILHAVSYYLNPNAAPEAIKDSK
jgi:hypothetical protein